MICNKIKKLRKKVSQEDYYDKRLWEIADKLDDLNHFHSFKCNSFFVGELKARLNTEKHNKKYNRLINKADWYEKKLSV